MKYIKLFLGILINFLCAVSLGTALLCVVFLLPNDNIDKHMVGTAETIWDEGVYPALSEGFSSTLDNFTDSLMLLEAADNNDAPALQRALSAFHGNIGEENNPAGMLVRHYLGQESFDRSYEYPRYWHGFLIFLRPLLMFFDLNQIRIINGICQALLVIITCGLMLKKKKDLYVIPWILGYLMLMPIVSAKSLQYSTCFYVFMTGSLVLLLLPKERLSKYGAFVFLNIGIALAYFRLSYLSDGNLRCADGCVSLPDKRQWDGRKDNQHSEKRYDVVSWLWRDVDIKMGFSQHSP